MPWQEHRMRDSVASYMRDSWRRSELQPALDQAQLPAAASLGGSTKVTVALLWEMSNGENIDNIMVDRW